MDCKSKKGNYHFKILDDTATQEYWIERGQFLWEEQLQNIVIESQMKRDSARRAEQEKLSNAKYGSRIFGEEEKEKSKKFGRRLRLIRYNESRLRTKPEILLPRPRSDWQDWRWLRRRNESFGR